MWADFTKSYVSGWIQLLKSFDINVSLYNEEAAKRILNCKEIYDMSYQIIKQTYETTREQYIQFIAKGLERQEMQYIVVADSIPTNRFRYRLVTLTGAIGQAISKGEILEVTDVDQLKEYIKAEPTTKSELVIPIHGNKYGVIGAINVESMVVNGFSNVDKNELMEIALIAGDIIETRNWVPSPVGNIPSFWFPTIEKNSVCLPGYSKEIAANHIEEMQLIQDNWDFKIDEKTLKFEDVRYFHVSERIRHAKDLVALGYVKKAIKLLESAPKPWRDDRISHELRILTKNYNDA